MRLNLGRAVRAFSQVGHHVAGVRRELRKLQDAFRVERVTTRKCVHRSRYLVITNRALVARSRGPYVTFWSCEHVVQQQQHSEFPIQLKIYKLQFTIT